MTLATIFWDVKPTIIDGPVTVRYYGLLFALAFLVGYRIMKWVYKKEHLHDEEVDHISMAMILGVVIGARLGHVFFYQPDYYLSHPIEILYIWEGGLASHGAAIGILLSIYFYSRRKAIKSYMWVLDRIILTVPIGGAFVRIGNLMNSEIYGKATDLPWGFVFLNDPQGAGNIPRHPTQIYEALGYVLIFIFLYLYYKKRTYTIRTGKMFGMFLILLFSLRFFAEFLKENQVDFESKLPHILGVQLNMGQLLSVPFILLGIGILVWSRNQPHGTMPAGDELKITQPGLNVESGNKEEY